MHASVPELKQQVHTSVGISTRNSDSTPYRFLWLLNVTETWESVYLKGKIVLLILVNNVASRMRNFKDPFYPVLY